MPGNPAELIQGDMVNPTVTEALVEKWGLNDPPLTRFFQWGGSILRLDFGDSLVTGRPVAEMLAPRIGYSVYLGVLCIVFGLLIGIPAGIISAVKRNTWVDDGLTLLMLLGVSLPTFVVALILQILLGRFPAPPTIFSIRRVSVLPFFRRSVSVSIRRRLMLA
jgi:peptide/nickel transport system permease protein